MLAVTFVFDGELSATAKMKLAATQYAIIANFEPRMTTLRKSDHFARGNIAQGDSATSAGAVQKGQSFQQRASTAGRRAVQGSCGRGAALTCQISIAVSSVRNFSNPIDRKSVATPRFLMTLCSVARPSSRRALNRFASPARPYI